MGNPAGRASTNGEKNTLLEELYMQWIIPPDMRLSQLIYNSVSYWMQKNGKPCADRDISRELFYVEDDDLLTTVALFVHDHYPPKAGSSTSS
jgi:hypothetical protein